MSLQNNICMNSEVKGRDFRMSFSPKVMYASSECSGEDERKRLLVRD